MVFIDDELTNLLAEPNADESGTGGGERIQLQTIDDYIWFTDIQGVDTATFNVHSVTHLSIAELLSMVGHDQPAASRISSTAIRELKEWATIQKQTDGSSTTAGV